MSASTSAVAESMDICVSGRSTRNVRQAVASPPVNAVQGKWTFQNVGLVGVVVAPREVKTRITPSCVMQFVDAVRQVEGVCCIVAEDADPNGSLHITTFAENLDSKKRKAIYEIEAQTILNNEKANFDFHLRKSEFAGTAAVIKPTKHIFMVWGALDASNGN